MGKLHMQIIFSGMCTFCLPPVKEMYAGVCACVCVCVCPCAVISIVSTDGNFIVAHCDQSRLPTNCSFVKPIY